MSKQENREKIYSTGGINWTWYIKLDHNEDGTVTALAHARFHNSDENHPKYDGLAQIYEDKARRIIGISIYDKGINWVYHECKNTPHVFSLCKKF